MDPPVIAGIAVAQPPRVAIGAITKAILGHLTTYVQIALLMMGEGEAFYNGERLPARKAMDKAGIPIPGLKARDGLAAPRQRLALAAGLIEEDR